MADKLAKARKELEKSVRKKYFEFDEIERAAPEVGVLSGKAAADRWRSSFKEEQSAWEIYERALCRNVMEFEYYGGSGAGAAGLSCSLRSVISRTREVDP